jgi:hypothetical protein
MPTYLIERYYITLYMSNMDVRNILQWCTASTITSWHHFRSTVTKNYQNLTQLWQCNGVRVHLCAYVPDWKVKKHVMYIQCGCGKQSKVNYRLNHDIMASFPLDCHPELLKPAVSLLFNLDAAQWERIMLFSDEQKLLFEGGKKGFAKNTKLDFMRR